MNSYLICNTCVVEAIYGRANTRKVNDVKPPPGGYIWASAKCPNHIQAWITVEVDTSEVGNPTSTLVSSQQPNGISMWHPSMG